MLPHLVTTVTGLVAIATEGICVSACACICDMRMRARPLPRASALAYIRVLIAWVRLVSIDANIFGVDANIFGVDANTVGIKANADVEITDQNILSKSRIDSYQYISLTVFENRSFEKLSNGRNTGFQESKRYRCWGMELFGLSRGESMTLCRIKLHSSPRTTV